ncbi:DUF6779 domain-containing protein [Gordonia sp. DT30]|uniref:DUF6779 domain-containing protein n=1 Tax=Gordonia sp. DT30 TaxID=3416546 RepID=UPI003CEDF009
MTTSTGRSTETRRTGRSVGQWLLGLLIVLALAASILMIFSNNLSVAGTLAVVAALWAAVIGAILVTRFRKQAETAEAKSRDLRLVYELQLEREIAARRQYELDVETTIRKEISAESGTELTALKEQVVSLRASLERLLGESLPDDQVALPNERLRELASGLGGGGLGPDRYGTSYGDLGHGSAAYDFSAPDDSVVAARDFAETVPAADDGRHIERTADPNEMTEVIPVVTEETLSGSFAAFGTAPEPDETASVVEEPVDLTSTQAPAHPGRNESGPNESHPAESAVFVDETPTDEWDRPAPDSATETAGAETAGAETAGAEPEPESAPTSEAVPAPTSEAVPAPTSEAVPAPTSEAVPAWARGRHETAAGPGAVGGRRRADEPQASTETSEPVDDPDSAHSNGLPVSELLRQLRNAEAGSGGRRRRGD